MSLDNLYRHYRQSGLGAIDSARLTTAEEHFYLALLAFGAGDLNRAARAGRTAAGLEPGRRLFAAGAEYLDRVLGEGKGKVYVTGAGFSAFIRGGGNIGLYQATSAALRAAYAEQSVLHLLDIGVGDGMALLPALTPQVAQVQLVEPSAALLDQTVAALGSSGVPTVAFAGTIQEFARQAPADGHWDLAQATYSLQSIPPDERGPAFQWLRRHADRLLLVEFDVPALCAEPLDPACVRHIVARYEAGLAEYPDDDGTVVQGFLMPVLFGYVDPTAARTNYEQPIAAWERELRAAGFAELHACKLFDYWWAPAYLLDARPGATPPAR